MRKIYRNSRRMGLGIEIDLEVEMEEIERGGENEPPSHGLLPMIATRQSPRSRLYKQKQGSRSFCAVFYMGNNSPNSWAIFPRLPRHISRKLDQKHNIQDTN